MPAKPSIREVLRATSWPLRSLLLLGLLLTLLITAGFAWYEHKEAFNDVRHDANRSVLAIEEHAANVLDTHSLVLQELGILTRGMTWEQISRDDRLKDSIGQLMRQFRHVASIGMTDAQGRVYLQNGREEKQEQSVATRDFFRAFQRGRTESLYIGEAFASASGGLKFGVSIARTTSDGQFDGVIFTAVPVDHLITFWRNFSPSSKDLIALWRTDGAVIARYPPKGDAEPVNPDGDLMLKAMRVRRGLYTAVSSSDGVERINAFSRIKNYPLYVSLSVDTRPAARRWWAVIGPVGGSLLVGATMMVGLWLLAVRHTYNQRLSAARWRDAARRLEREVERRELAEEALRQGRKMEAIGQLAGGIAHDFNNLLGGITGNLHLIRMRLKQGRTENLAHYVDAAESVVRRASTMTQRLLAFSRRQTLDPQPTDVNERVHFMQELIGRTVGPSIRLRIALAHGRCVTLCDANQLENALLNLAINARDAMPAGGELTITTTCERLSVQQAGALGITPGEHVSIAVKDTGSGMTPEVVQRAFDPFFTTKPIGEGTGLGLSMVYGFVTQSGGQVKIDSAPGAGTTVTILLPAHEGEVPASAPMPITRAAPRATAPTRVLLVDDEESLRGPLVELLTELGYEVTQAADAKQALNALRSPDTVHLLVTDVGLPGHMNGRQLADAAREQRPGLKVLFITGYDAAAASAESLLGTGMEIMIKPFRLDDFAHKVAKMTTVAQPAQEDAHTS
jgi:signal transduction histidine kinase/ActR/RegA family two-component response regulator